MFTLSQIAEALGRPVEGDGTRTFARAAEPGAAGPHDLALAMSADYAPALREGRANVAILWEGADWREFGLSGAVTVPRARLAMSRITRALDPGPFLDDGIHPTAILAPGVEIGEGSAIGPYVVIGPGARIGARARIAAHVTIGQDASIGDDALMMPQVHIGARCRVGHGFIAQPGAKIGGDGFSFVTPEESGVERARRTLGDQGDLREQAWTRIHSLGAVEIGDDVEIGANSTIDRGTVADTTIGRGTKIDNLVMIGHNNNVGEDCLFCSQVGIAGGTTIGDRVVLAGKVGVNDNITVGNDVVAGGGTNIYTRVRDGEVIMGSPAVKMETNMAMYRALRRLPRALEQLGELRQTVRDRMRDGRNDG